MKTLVFQLVHFALIVAILVSPDEDFPRARYSWQHHLDKGVVRVT